MNKILLTFLLNAFGFVFIAYAQPKSIKETAGQEEAVATFAQGCFWHTEMVFQSLVGVREAVSGYAGGAVMNPTYEEVSTGQTGHAESVQVFYNPKQISFKTLVEAYFASMDPTTLNRQGNDIGTQYRSIAFYSTEEEKKIIQEVIRQLALSKKYSKPIVTQLVKLDVFYPAEKYHQEFIKNHPNHPYVKSVCYPEYLHFRQTFKGIFKD